MRYPEEITLEVRNEDSDKKRRFTDASVFEKLKGMSSWPVALCLRF